MKKELLMGTALVSTLGAASVAEAVTATMSGNHQTGVEFDSPTGGTDTNAQKNDNNFTVSLSETTDGGMTISSSFKVMDENTKEDYDAGFTLAFTDGSKLDVLNAGNASASHAVSVPSSAGAEGVTVTSSNTASTGLDFATDSTALGVEYHTAADFVADGLSMSVSASTDNGEAATTTYRTDSHFAIGATYVTDMGDSAVTIGAGYSETQGSRLNSSASGNDTTGFHVGLSAVTGDLTVAVGFADGDDAGISDNGSDEMKGDVVKAGVKYVSGDLTFNVGIANGAATDNAIGSTGGNEDTVDSTSASVSYAVASGVTAILGYTTVEATDEGQSTDDGSAWYIGANMSF
jgi:predicted porin